MPYLVLSVLLTVGHCGQLCIHSRLLYFPDAFCVVANSVVLDFVGRPSDTRVGLLLIVCGVYGENLSQSVLQVALGHVWPGMQHLGALRTHLFLTVMRAIPDQVILS